jgi:hypothetical protein
MNIFPIVIFRPSIIFATGGTVTTYGGYRVHTFTTSGTLTVTTPGPIDYLIVAGGGGGGGSGYVSASQGYGSNWGKNGGSGIVIIRYLT